ncbi:hypothetical protein F4818DRAFT_437314 [Hypoxylon cercidicola]|nr:hypothetical protein F4818DRAFT_437314 [Hypoxylon cercidicola]
METIKRLINPSKKKWRRMANKKYLISSPLELQTLDFTPRGQAHDASIAYAKSGTSKDLTRLLDERDRGETHVRRGPKTNGTGEVQRVLREPSIRSVEKLHHAFKQAEFSLRYGSCGRLLYNFSKSLAWNKARVPRLPSLQLTDFGDMIKESMAAFSSNTHVSHNPTPVGEVRRDPSSSSRDDTHEDPDGNPDDLSLKLLDSNVPEAEWEMQEAKALTVIQVPISKVRKVEINLPRNGR